MGDKIRVFISHSSLDKDRVNVLAESLESLGCTVFYSSDASTNTIGYGTDFYQTIDKEIKRADVVLFMVSSNFYNSVASLIEVGISYSEKKRMIPVGFKFGNYQNDLKGVFNTNLRLASLDNEDDVVNILSISNSTDIQKLIKCKNKILEPVSTVEEENIVDVVEVIDNYTNNEVAVFSDINDEVLVAVNKIKRLSKFEYLFIKYICEDRVNSFCFSEDNYHWSYDFERWTKIEGINILREEVWNERFIRLLDRFNLLEYSQGENHITQLGMDTIEYIYDRDKDIIDEIVCRFYTLPF